MFIRLFFDLFIYLNNKIKKFIQDDGKYVEAFINKGDKDTRSINMAIGFYIEINFCRIKKDSSYGC